MFSVDCVPYKPPYMEDSKLRECLRFPKLRMRWFGKSLAFRGELGSLLVRCALCGVSPRLLLPQESRNFPTHLCHIWGNGSMPHMRGEVVEAPLRSLRGRYTTSDKGCLGNGETPAGERGRRDPAGWVSRGGSTARPRKASLSPYTPTTQ